VSLAGGYHLQVGDFEMRGFSIAGVGTCLYFPRWNICFDLAQGLPFALRANQFFITHGHQDHAGGIAYIISQKTLSRQKTPVFFMPKVLVEPLERIMRTWIEIEGHNYQFEFKGVDEDSVIQLAGPYFVRPFTTVHRVLSQGYTIFAQHKKLKGSYREMSRDQLLRQKELGHEIQNFSVEPLVSFTGDTQIEFLNGADWVRNSKTLIMEVTYLDEKKPVTVARERGHIHLDELIERLPEIKAENIILMHLSARYSIRDVESLVKRRVPKAEQGRLHLFYTGPRK
jgi:ribonuclease Z